MEKIQKVRKEILNEIRRLGFDGFYDENNAWVDGEGNYHYYANELNEKLIKAYIETFGKVFLIDPSSGNIIELTSVDRWYPGYSLVVPKVDDKLKELLKKHCRAEVRNKIQTIKELFDCAVEVLGVDAIRWV